MTAVSCLRTIYQQCPVDIQSATPFGKFVDAYLKDDVFDGELIEQVFACEANILQQDSPWDLVDQWRELLTVMLIVRDRELHSVFKPLIIKRVQYLNHIALWAEFQLLSAYQALMGVLLEQPVKELTLCQFPSGACPLEGGGHWAWGDIPHPLFHAELGTLWCLYGALTGNKRFLKAAEMLAQWQQNVLDHDFLPFAGLFSQEGDASELSLVSNNFVLFDAVARTSARADMACCAEKQLSRLTALMGQSAGVLNGHMLTLGTWFGRHFAAVAAADFHLPEAFDDSYLAMAGCRGADSSAVATLYGGGSGMGCMHHGDIQVVNFGPQHLPLGNCLGFGLEGGGRLLAGRVKSVAAAEGVFTIEGVARMAARPKAMQSLAGFRQGDPGGIWIDTRLEFQKGHLCIETAFNGIFEPTDFAFVFFVKAASCLVGGTQVIAPRSFQRYQGAVCPVQLKGCQAVLMLEAGHTSGQMQVIPLGGGQNFWGADFLIAYQCSGAEECYRWQLA